jgi:glutamate:GABA antiporter
VGRSGFVDAYSAVAATFHSHGLHVLFAILLIVTLLSSGAVWLEGADRTQAIASLDGAGPRRMGRFTSFGTPIAVNIMSGIVASAFVFFAFLITSGKLASFFAAIITEAFVAGTAITLLWPGAM